MDDKMVQDAAYRGTLRAFATLLFLLAGVGLLLSLGAGSASGAITALALIALGWFVKALAIPRAPRHAEATARPDEAA